MPLPLANSNVGSEFLLFSAPPYPPCGLSLPKQRIKVIADTDLRFPRRLCNQLRPIRVRQAQRHRSRRSATRRQFQLPDGDVARRSVNLSRGRGQVDKRHAVHWSSRRHVQDRRTALILVIECPAQSKVCCRCAWNREREWMRQLRRKLRIPQPARARHVRLRRVIDRHGAVQRYGHWLVSFLEDSAKERILC